MKSLLLAFVFILVAFKSEVDAGSCPKPSGSGTASKLAGFKSSFKTLLDQVCKKKASITDDLIKKAKSDCLDSEVMPCVPSDIRPLLSDCIEKKDVLCKDNICDTGKHDEVLQCVNDMYEANKDSWKETLKGETDGVKNIDVVCDRLNFFSDCIEEFAQKLK